MTATCRTIVNLALRKLGKLASGREARLSDATDALEALQGLYGSWIASGAFGRLRDVVPTGASYVATGSERIFRMTPTLDVILPELVSDLQGTDYGRIYYGTTVTVETSGLDTVVSVSPSQPISYAITPRDGQVVIIFDRVGGQTVTYLYDGTVKQWQQIEGLTLDDDAPRSSADPQGLAACLAMEVADQYGIELTAATAQQAARYKSAMVNRFGMRSNVVAGVYM